MADINKLAHHLESEPRYDEQLRLGNNSALVRLINDVQTGSGKSWVDIDSNKFSKIVMTEFQLTTQQETKIQTFLSQPKIYTSNPTIVEWLKNILSEQAFKQVEEHGSVENTWAVTAGVVSAGEKVTVNDIRRAVRKIDKSFIIASGQAKKE
jgi:hypothetical protein